jgi:hypothetical protein
LEQRTSAIFDYQAQAFWIQKPLPLWAKLLFRKVAALL